MPSDESNADPSTRTRRGVLALGAGVAGATLAGCFSRAEGDPSSSDPSEADEPSDTPTNTRETSHPPPEPSLLSPWPKARADPENTAAVADAGPKTAPVERWKDFVETGGTRSPAAGSSGVFATGRGDRLYALTDDGSVDWVARLDDEAAGAPAVAENRVVAGSADGAIEAYDPGDGSPLWKTETKEGLFPPHASDGSVFAVDDDAVYVVHNRGFVLALSLADGDERWRSSVPTRPHRPRLVDGAVVCGASGGSGGGGAVVALDAADGSERWRVETERTVGTAVGVNRRADEPVVYAGTIDGTVLALSAGDGSERWRASVDDWVATTPVVAADRLWVGTLREGLHSFALDGSDHRHREVDVRTTPVVGEDTLYFGVTAGPGYSETPDGECVALDAASGELRWRRALDGPPRTPLALHDDHLYVGDRTGVCWRLSPASGDVEWRHVARPPSLPEPAVAAGGVYTGSPSSGVTGTLVTSGDGQWYARMGGDAPSTPAVIGNRVVAGSADGDVTATEFMEYADVPAGPLGPKDTPGPSETPTPHVDYPRPERFWETSLGRPVEGNVASADGLALVGTGGDLVALRVDGGTERWRNEPAVHPDAQVVGTPAVRDDTVVVGRSSGEVAALDLESGETRWTIELDGQVTTSSALADDGIVLGVAAHGGPAGAVVCLDPSNGSERWRVRTPAPVRGSPAVADGVAVVGTDAGRVRALATADGSERWQVETGGPVRGSPAIADGIVYAGSRDGHLYALSLADGSERWRHELDAWVDGPPVVAYGAVFVADQSGWLTCLVAPDSD